LNLEYFHFSIENELSFINEDSSWNKKQKKILLISKTNNIIFKTMISSGFSIKLFENKYNEENIFNIHFFSPQ
jgi:hypothetical protein